MTTTRPEDIPAAAASPRSPTNSPQPTRTVSANTSRRRHEAATHHRQTLPGWGCAARLRGRPSGLKGRCAIALGATALRAALDPGASTTPAAGIRGQARSLPRPGAAHVPTDQVSTLSGDCHRSYWWAGGFAGRCGLEWPG